MESFEDKLNNVQKTKKPLKTNPSEVMAFLGVARRGWRVDKKIIQLLEKYDLMAEPNFEDTWKWGEVVINPKPKVPAGKGVKIVDDYDPTPRISLLRASNLSKIEEETGAGLLSVTKNTKLSEATTLMRQHDFSQLPILSGKEVEGMISWRSIGKALTLGKKCVTVSDCKEDVKVLYSHEPLFSAVKIILEKEVFLVKQKQGNYISGIVTASDIAEQFLILAEPFLILEQIENHIRILLDEKYDIEVLKKAINPNDGEREIKALSDLNFGEYIRIIENPDNFLKLNVNIDRKLFVKQLHIVRNIRNDVMHFDPDGVSENDLNSLRRTAVFLAEINSII